MKNNKKLFYFADLMVINLSKHLTIFIYNLLKMLKKSNVYWACILLQVNLIIKLLVLKIIT